MVSGGEAKAAAARLGASQELDRARVKVIPQDGARGLKLA